MVQHESRCRANGSRAWRARHSLSCLCAVNRHHELINYEIYRQHSQIFTITQKCSVRICESEVPSQKLWLTNSQSELFENVSELFEAADSSRSDGFRKFSEFLICVWTEFESFESEVLETFEHFEPFRIPSTKRLRLWSEETPSLPFIKVKNFLTATDIRESSLVLSIAVRADWRSAKENVSIFIRGCVFK